MTAEDAGPRDPKVVGLGYPEKGVNKWYSDTLAISNMEESGITNTVSVTFERIRLTVERYGVNRKKTLHMEHLERIRTTTSNLGANINTKAKDWLISQPHSREM